MSTARLFCVTVLLVSALLADRVCEAGERPYFVTYEQTMEEPGNLEIEARGLTASPQAGNTFLSGVTEFEYGARGWWTTEFYLDGQTTSNESTIFTGFRWENRFRLLLKEHKINHIASREYANEIEARLILSSNLNGWNLSENFIAEKILSDEPWEFGYAVAVSRPLSLIASASECKFCRENFQAGVEFYGGLGTADRFTVHGTSQYVAPVLAW